VPLSLSPMSFVIASLTLHLFCRSWSRDASLKGNGQKCGGFYPEDLESAACAPVLLDILSTHSQEIIISNMRKMSSLTLGILKSLYPWTDMDMVGEGFMATYTEEEANQHVEDSIETVPRVIEMLPVNMS
jgi:hypothetical protein